MNVKTLAKKIISRVGYHLGLWPLITGLMRDRGKPRLAVFTYHRVTDNPRRHEFLSGYDRGTSPEELEAQLTAIKRLFDVVDLSEFSAIIRGERPLDLHTAMITFDDADSEFADVVVPILKKYDIPAVVFVPTRYADGDLCFWSMRLSSMMQQMTPAGWDKLREHSHDLPPSIAHILNAMEVRTPEEVAAAWWQLVMAFDQIPDALVSAIVAKWESLADTAYVTGIKGMTWEQIKALDSIEIDFQSHTVNHRKLAFLDYKQNLEELKNSREILESRLNKNINAICYPGGSYNDDSLDAARTAGYDLGFTTRQAWCQYPRTGKGLYTIPRWYTYGERVDEAMFQITRLFFRRVEDDPAS